MDVGYLNTEAETDPTMSEREITSSGAHDEQIRFLLLDGSVDDRLHIYRKLGSLSLSLVSFRAAKSAFEGLPSCYERKMRSFP